MMVTILTTVNKENTKEAVEEDGEDEEVKQDEDNFSISTRRKNINLGKNSVEDFKENGWLSAEEINILS